MPTSDGARAAHAVLMESATAHRARAAPVSIRARRSIVANVGVARWTGYAWGAIAATVAFIAMTAWWLTQNHTIPIYDAGDHLEIAFRFRDMIQAGNLLGPFNYVSV